MSTETKTYPLPFTQFHMPNGRQESVSTSVGEAEFEQWKKIRERGFRLTCEMLSDWTTISVCIEDRELGDFDCVLAPNGPEVPKQISAMLLRYDDKAAAKFTRGRKNKTPPIEPLLWEKPKSLAYTGSVAEGLDDPTMPF